MSPYCANCPNYFWDLEVEFEPGSLELFSNCKFVYYCSVQCQKEHWVKVHRDQCEYLAGTKVLSQSSHDTATCTTCQEERNMDDIHARPDNPKFGCFFYVLGNPKIQRSNYKTSGSKFGNNCEENLRTVDKN